MSGSLKRRDVLGGAAALAAAITLGAGRGAQAREPEDAEDMFSDEEIQGLVNSLDHERRLWIDGKIDPPDIGPNLKQADDMSIFGPFGGPLASGGAELHERQRRGSAQFGGGTGRHELVRAIQQGGLVVLIMNEWNEVKFPGREEPCSWNLRTTQVFRREGTQWERLHRHADPLHERRSLDETLDLFQCQEGSASSG